ncbi:enoyl-CoA hydratase protein (plasmid) [Rhizobium etli 8C-3]|jgi:methylglutaconyl-CoA hydratase|uniref:Methylglutaconyl-CoA hydratase n=2 Tax=Rhizobium TaxID=379 RepID=A0A4R3RTG5_9HYPH|nr:enoyl-CoA hydratase protein [Rhizobium etli 8C-3]TCU24605.1 methylglutaconyl-CoA hydratase [Rhizobium azibense]TCU39353.1 methylglutaconyl-CoA hydratase [Rhizobium azibense]
MPETLRIDIDARGLARLTLARPEKHNAISPRMMDELTAASKALGADRSVRVIVLAAEGASFCAGGDLGWMRAQFEAGRAERMSEARRLATMFRALNEIPKAVIARVQGNAYGGGVGLVSVCDLVIATESARFGLTEARLGIIPATISPFVVARIGEGAARPLIMSGKLISASEAKAAGLAAHVVPTKDLDAAVEAEVGHFLRASPDAAARAKTLARSLGMPITDAVIESVIEQLADTWETEEAREGIAAFFEGREPSWRSDA